MPYTYKALVYCFNCVRKIREELSDDDTDRPEAFDLLPSDGPSKCADCNTLM